MSTDLKQYHEQGYVVVRKFFKREDIHILLGEAKQVFANAYNPQSIAKDMFIMTELFRTQPEVFINCGKQVQHLINLHRLSLHPRVISLLHSVGMKWPVICTRPVMFFNHPWLARERIYHTMDAHQDWRSMQGSSNAAVLWVPMMDVTEEVGPLHVLPGSHLGGLRTTSMDHGFGMVSLTAEEQLMMKSVPLEAGDILLFHSMLIHSSGTNRTANPRWSAHFRYNDLDDAAFIERGYVHPYIYKPGEGLLPGARRNPKE